MMINMNLYLKFTNLILNLYPHLSMFKVGKNKVIRNDIIKLDNERTWISPTKSLSRKIVHYKALFLQTSQYGYIMMQSYMDTHLCHVLYMMIWQLNSFSHQSEIEIGIYACKSMEVRICGV